MSAGWLSLIPARLLERPATGWNLAALGRARRLSGVVMVVDVCGFTALSEAAGREGPEGTERLSQAINAVFTPIVSLVHEHGGEVALFVGDAVVAILPGAAAARTCAAAIHARAGSYKLSVGLAAGDLTSTVVGDPKERLEHVLIGRALARAAAAERRAGPGRTVEDGTLVDGAVARSYFDAPGLVAPFVHPSVAARLDAGRDRLLAEHRRVTSLFCRFEDLREDDPEAPARLQSLVSAALEALARYGGALLQVELVDKGSTLKATFGAPLAHEDDERRATACARTLLERPELAGAAIGISSGTVLCGLIGSAARREYTVLGDAVNVAARLMLAAQPGQILVSEATRDRAGAAWRWRALGPLAVRGRADPVAAFEPTAADDRQPGAVRPPLALVGRRQELRIALDLLARAREGHGAVLTIEGEAGIGKSRLLDELAGEAAAGGVDVIRGAGQAYGRDFAYGAWRQAGRELIGDPAALGERAPLAAPLLGVTAADTPLTAGLSPELRAQALQELVVERLKARRAAPLLLAFEDCHWLDTPSRELLERIAREVADLRLLLVLTVRTGEARDGAMPRVQRSASLTLEALGSAGLELLVRARHPDTPAGVVKAVVARCGGNPLFAEELVALAHDRGDAASLPDSLRAVVTARLDTLGEHQRAALRIASVVGPRFKPDWLWGIDPALGGRDAVARTLATLERLDLVQAGASEHGFKHAVTRDVAYDTLALEAREHLHHAVARYVERTHDVALPDVVEALAHHYGRSADAEKQRVYLRRAGDAARNSYSNEAAIRHYRGLIDVLEGGDALEATLDLGGVLQLTGEWVQAEALYARVLEDAERLGLGRIAARARAALGGLLAFTGAYPRAVGRLEEARVSFAALGDRVELAGVLERLAHTYFQQGDDERALACAGEHARLARDLGDQAGESTAMETIGLVLWHRGELEPARRRLESALALAETAGHRVGVVHALNDLAGVLVALQRPRDAIARLGEAYAIAQEIGYRRFAGVIVGNAAELFHIAGDDGPALACAGRALEIATSLHDVIEVLHSATVIAGVRRRRGDPEEADALLERIADAARASDNRRYLAEARLHQARARWDLGRPEAAAIAAAEALDVARAIGQADIAAEAEALMRRTEPASPEPAPARGGAPAGAAPFLDRAASAPDPVALTRRAETALAALG